MAIITDTFTEASNTALASHTPDTGGTWSVGSGTWTVYGATDELGCDSREFAWNSSTFSSADCYAEVTAKTDSASTVHQFGCCVRSSAYGRGNASANRYWCYVDGAGSVFAQKEISGASSQIGSTGSIASFSTTTYYLVRLQASGSSITVDVDGVNEVTVTDTAITGANLSGLYFRNTNPRVTLFNSDVLGGSTIYTRTLSDALATSDGPLRGVRAFRKMDANATSVTEGVLRGARAFRNVNDAASVVERLLRSKLHGRGVADSVTLSDVASRAVRAYRNTYDTVSASDGVLRFAKMFRSMLDTTLLGDVLTSTVTSGAALIQRLLQDGVVLTEDVRRQVLAFRKEHDDIAVLDILAVLITLGGVTIVTRVLQDNLSVAEVVQRAVRMYRLESQAVDARDGTWYSTSVVRRLTETLQTAETAARAMLRGRVVSDHADAADLAFRYALLDRLLHDDAEASDSLASQITYFQTLIGFVLMSLRNDPVVMALDESLVETSIVRDQPILLEMRNV
jgi:hypothetical protein